MSKKNVVLPDGAVVRVGSIVTLIDGVMAGNNAGVTTMIVDIEDFDSDDGEFVECLARGIEPSTFTELVSDLRLATNDEKRAFKNRVL